MVFRGFVSDTELIEAYTRSRIFCMPSIAELQSIATMEAMAAGNAILAADAMALPHLVRPGENGWLFRPGDVRELRARLTDLLADPGRRAQMGQTSAELVRVHDLGATLRAFEEIYGRVIHQ